MTAHQKFPLTEMSWVLFEVNLLTVFYLLLGITELGINWMKIASKNSHDCYSPHVFCLLCEVGNLHVVSCIALPLCPL